jgi:hypothetical protein
MNNILKMIYMELIGELGAIPHVEPTGMRRGIVESDFP